MRSAKMIWIIFLLSAACVLGGCTKEPKEDGAAEEETSSEGRAQEEMRDEPSDDRDFGEVLDIFSDSQTLEGEGYPSAEEAVEAYIAALSKGDIEGIISTFAVESYVDNFDTEAYLEQLGAWNAANAWSTGAKVTGDEYERRLLIAGRALSVVQQLYLQFADYTGILNDQQVLTLPDQNAVEDFLAENQGDGFFQAISGMELERFLNPQSLSANYPPENLEENLARYGFDEYQEVAAQVELGGEDWLLVMLCARKGENWYNLNYSGTLGAMLGMPAASAGMMPMSELGSW